MLSGVFKLALAIILWLAVAAVPARAESVTLSCRAADDGPATWTLRIDYGKSPVEELGPSGNTYTNRSAPSARISDNAIVWSVTFLDDTITPPSTAIWEGNVDRLSGTGSMSLHRARYSVPGQDHATRVTCRQVTQKF